MLLQWLDKRVDSSCRKLEPQVSTWRSVLPSNDVPPPITTHHSGRTLSTPSFTSVTCAQWFPPHGVCLTGGFLDRSGLMEVTFSSGSHPVPPYSKDQMAVLLLGCCPPTATSTSPAVLACLLVSPPHSRHCAGRRSRPSGHSVYSDAALLEQLLWAADTSSPLPIVARALGKM